MHEIARQKFISHFNTEPLMVRSPGRINVAGEHMDYNLGSSMAAAIDREITVCIQKNNTRDIGIYASDFNEEVIGSIDHLFPTVNHWSNYIYGVVAELKSRGVELSGFNCSFGGSIPIGAGLSSSAAVTSGIAFSLLHLFKLNIDKKEMAKICMNAEHKFADVKCGLLDPLTILLGKKDRALLLNFKTLEHDYIDLDTGEFRFLLFNSNVSHSLSESGHLNERFESCHRGLNALKNHFCNVNALCDASPEQLLKVKDELSPVDFNRCRYIVEEMERFNQAKKFLQTGDMHSYGRLMYQTHEGMSTMYDISCKELELLIGFSKQHPDIIGARMMGGGYGGCTLNLVHKSKVNEITKEVTQYYNRMAGLPVSIYTVNFTDGVGIINDPG